jgi:hypothetical protein
MKMFFLSLIVLVFASANYGLAEEVSVVATKESCRKLVAHHPSVGVAYTPGVDVKGRPVVPADLPSSGGLAGQLPKEFEFSIAVNPLKGSAANRFAETKLDLGRIRFDAQTGVVTYNGKPLQGVAYNDLVQKCREMSRTKR